MRIIKLFVAAAVPFVLLGCPDKASPDPAMAAKDGGMAMPATTGPHPAGSAAAPAKSGGGW